MNAKFKVGDILELNPTTRGFGALKGAKAKVTGYTDDGNVLVEWIDSKRQNQANGDYKVDDFVLAGESKKIIKVYGIVAFMKGGIK